MLRRTATSDVVSLEQAVVASSTHRRSLCFPENEFGEAQISLQSEAPSYKARDQTLVLVSQAAEVLYEVQDDHNFVMPFHGGC